MRLQPERHFGCWFETVSKVFLYKWYNPLLKSRFFFFTFTCVWHMCCFIPLDLFSVQLLVNPKFVIFLPIYAFPSNFLNKIQISRRIFSSKSVGKFCALRKQWITSACNFQTLPWVTCGEINRVVLTSSCHWGSFECFWSFLPSSSLKNELFWGIKQTKISLKYKQWTINC